VADEHEHHHDHDHDHDHDEDVPDMTEWVSNTQKATCPACGAAGALTLGGGIFCPTCGEVSTNPGYTPPAE
jgi:ribosomal protein L37AE/L43A